MSPSCNDLLRRDGNVSGQLDTHERVLGEFRCAPTSSSPQQLPQTQHKQAHILFIALPSNTTRHCPRDKESDCDKLPLQGEEFVEQSAYEAAQLLERRKDKLSGEVEAARFRLQELTARLQKAQASLKEEAEAENQVC